MKVTDAERIAERIDALIGRYYHKADEDQRTQLEILSGLMRLVTTYAVRLSTELDQYVHAANTAEEQRDELQARLDEVDADLEELRSALAAGIAGRKEVAS